MLSESYNNLSETVLLSESQAKLDECCKALLAEKQFLAWILQSCEEAYKDKSIDEIIACIEGEPEIGTIPVEEELENKYTSEKISGMSTESASKYEGTIRYVLSIKSLKNLRLALNLPKNSIRSIRQNIADLNRQHPLITNLRGVFAHLMWRWSKTGNVIK